MSIWQEDVLPEIDNINETFFRKLKENQLWIQRCKSCGNVQFYPRPLCIKCGSIELEWIQIKSKGRIYSYTVIYRIVNNTKELEKFVPYIVASIEFSEGFRIYGLVKTRSPSNLKIGDEVVLDAITIKDIGLPAFKLVKEMS